MSLAPDQREVWICLHHQGDLISSYLNISPCPTQASYVHLTPDRCPRENFRHQRQRFTMAVVDEKPNERLSADDKTEVGSGIIDPNAKPEPEATTETRDEIEEAAGGDTTDYPHGLKLALIISSLCLAIFLVALDQTIIAPALGAITAHYKSVKDIVSFILLR